MKNELQSLIDINAETLMSRVYAAIPPDNADLLDLCEQWVGAFQMALRYAGDQRARLVADDLLQQLLRGFKTAGITSF